MTSKEWVQNELSLSWECLTTTDRFMLNKILQDLDRLEELEKENEDLRIENAEAFHNLAIQDYFLGKFKVAIEQAIELLSVDGKGTKQEVKKLLSEVLENE